MVGAATLGGALASMLLAGCSEPEGLMRAEPAVVTVKFDFDHLGALVKPNGLILLHDACSEGRGFTAWEVKRFLEAEVRGSPAYEVLVLDQHPGLAIVKKIVEEHGGARHETEIATGLVGRILIVGELEVARRGRWRPGRHADW